MINQEIPQAIAWFEYIRTKDTEFRNLIGQIILQEKYPDKYQKNEPTKEDLQKFFKNISTTSVIDKLVNLNSAVLRTKEGNGNIIDFDLIRFLENASIIHIFKAKRYKNLNSLNALPNLQILHLHKCHNLNAFIKIKDFKTKIDLYISDTKEVFLKSFININNLQSITIMNCEKVCLATIQHYRFLKEIRIMYCTDANIVIDFAKFPNLTSLIIQETTGKVDFINTSEARHLSFANIQQLGRTPQIEEILLNPEPQSFELV
jgi:hypothetical protein